MKKDRTPQEYIDDLPDMTTDYLCSQLDYIARNLGIFVGRINEATVREAIRRLQEQDNG